MCYAHSHHYFDTSMPVLHSQSGKAPLHFSVTWCRICIQIQLCSGLFHLVLIAQQHNKNQVFNSFPIPIYINLNLKDSGEKSFKATF
jgi:hypothetical protein